MNIIKNAAAGLVLAIALPLIVGAAADPLGDDGVLDTWARGAELLGALVAIEWAVGRLGGSREQAD